jgi:hypothetical protein
MKQKIHTIVPYKAKVKLHGTNAGITFYDGNILPQSKNKFINEVHDNCGFASWLKNNIDYFKNLNVKSATIFGEWCGTNIMAGAAICEIPKRIYAVYAIQQGDEIIFEPNEINDWFGDVLEDMYILPWQTETIQIPFIDKTQLTQIVETLNKYVEDVEKCDPFVYENFNICGTGEGLVFYPVNVKNRDKWSSLMFKCKGKEHRVQHDRRAVIIDPEEIATIEEFAHKFVTSARCDQGVRHLNDGLLIFDIEQLDLFVAWMCKDIKKESKAELSSFKYSWKKISTVIAEYAKQWYIRNV